ncbi:unnamed protein product [Chondrus crispus]|uniref:tRNA(adenine(34)) deaminase n=1 Tax=Chondrus crispus TaxID=2769 RepID=R7QAE3_CHOCR|nr:unnamed protein product [Chondrus crispus]CDF34768.1 unnamed protein product [Chondrus crispus]|eukprot:XP_005714587.1 unnamed protein product [Chondrus crispus]
MREALAQARRAYSPGEVPVGAVLVCSSGAVLSAAHNLVESLHDPTAHAEILCVRRAAAAAGNWRLHDTTLYSTLEPCPMCLSALALARVDAVVYAAKDLRLGVCGTWLPVHEEKHPFHTFRDVRGGVLEDEAAELMRHFFRERRAEGKAARGDSCGSAHLGCNGT